MTRVEAIEILTKDELNALTYEERSNILLGNWWCLDESDAEFRDLQPHLKNAISNTDSPPDADNPEYDSMITAVLGSKYVGVRNEYVAGRLKQVTGEDRNITGVVEDLYECPCCHYKTLNVPDEASICTVCFWENWEDIDPEHYSGPNHQTLASARAMFELIGACSERYLDSIDRDGPLKYIKVE